MQAAERGSFYLLGTYLLINITSAAPNMNVSTPPSVNNADKSDSLEINKSEDDKTADKISNPFFGNVEDDGNIADYADLISIADEASIGDEGLVLAHIESDIEDFEDLKKTVVFLEHHLRKHADINIVKSSELVEAHEVLKELDVKVIKFYEQELMSLKTQIPKLNHTFDNRSMEEISSIVENAELFLQLSMDKIEELEMREQEWEVAEESAEIQEMIKQDEVQEYGKKILIEALKPSVGDEVKHKLSNMEDTSKPPIAIAYPTSKQGGVQTKLEGKSLLKKMKKMKMLKSGEHYPKLVEPDARMDSDEVYANKEPSIVNDADLVQENSEKDLVPDDTDEDIDERDNTRLVDMEEMDVAVKDTVEMESLSYQQHMSKGFDTVEHYSKKVKEALKKAKEMSHEFIDKKLNHHGMKPQEDATFSSLHIVLAMMVLIALVVSYCAFRAYGRKKKASVVFQNLSGFGGCDRSYTELESIREDDGWGNAWSPWTAHKKQQNKFK